MRPFAVIGLGLLTLACGPSAGAPASGPLSAAALDSVRAVDAAFAAAVNAGDTAAVVAIYAPDAKLMPPDSPVLEGPAIRGMIAGLLQAGVSNFTLSPETVYGTGDLAYVVGTASYIVGGSQQTDKYLEVLRRGPDGTWHYVVDMFSGITPVPAPAPAAN